MDQDRNQTQQQGKRNQNQPQGNKPSQSKQRPWDGHERRTGAERRNSDTGMQMNEGSSR